MNQSRAPVAGSVSMVIPVYNEEEIIADTLRRTAERLRQRGDDFEIVVVDDASTDHTAEILTELCTELPELHCLTHARNRKLGGALQTAFRHCSKDLIFYMDADQPFALDEIHAALDLADDFTIVIGKRLGRAAGGRRRALQSLVYNKLIDLLFHTGVSDINFSLKVFPCSLVEPLALRSTTSFLDAELIIKARRLGVKVVELPVRYQPRTAGASQLGGLRDILSILSSLVRFCLERRGRAGDASCPEPPAPKMFKTTPRQPAP